MFKLLLKIVIGIIQVPLTLMYFVMNFIGSIFAGAGWMLGVIIFLINGICWMFGQFTSWYQPIIGIAIAVAVTFVPAILTDVGGSTILKIKGLLQSIV